MAYNGHPSHAAWNVSLWLATDESLPLPRNGWAEDCWGIG